MTSIDIRGEAADADPPADLAEVRDATALAALMRGGAVSAAEAADAAIARIERLDGALNAVVATRFDAARAEATALDGRPADDRGAPFFGVPCLVKDLAAVAGTPLTFGSRLFADYVARRDDPIVEVCRAAGMTVLGKTNTPEFGLLGATEPLLHGPTRNPWDPALSAGGSSGGAAAAVASGLVPFAQASDGGGSIRIPAAACGLFGFKPTRSLGVAPLRAPPGGLSATFCVTRSVRDAETFLEASEAARAAAAGDAAAFHARGPQPLRPLRIAVSPLSVSGAAPDAETAAALASAARLLEELGHHVDEAGPRFEGPLLDAETATEHLLALWSAVPDFLRRRFLALRVVARGLKPWRWPSYEDAFEPWTRGLAERFRLAERARPGQARRAIDFFAAAAPAYDAFFADFDVLMTPVTLGAGARLGVHAPDRPFDALLGDVVKHVGYTPVQNALGGPAMSVPLHWTASGAPVGVHFAAATGTDARLMALAHQLETARPWAQRRPNLAWMEDGA